MTNKKLWESCIHNTFTERINVRTLYINNTPELLDSEDSIEVLPAEIYKYKLYLIDILDLEIKKISLSPGVSNKDFKYIKEKI